MIRLPLLLAAATLAAPVLAAPTLISATPAADAKVTAPSRIDLRFSERVMPRLSTATIAMTGMGGMAHAPMPVTGAKASVTPTGNGLGVTLARPLAPGTYRVDWHVLSGKGDHATGSYAFTVD
ncbi:copper homeostasis periplasmic binding protein CopC [Sphingomonas abaci]|uniref:CopC domain-containing protein n=1 Tax=Sphingomonas abaci TaxID=237611 RepID=A0A7W7AK91_9SPHN|nr:copper homeostasis periplasmic binding protein CopC [Sphingomonas abaci]MBB4618592.1 hypothetical protein [Sphingomonas abaci]